MKKIVKKSCTFLFVFAMLLSMFCVSFSAETYYYDKNFEFYKNDYSGLTITDYLGTEENLQIPSQLIDITVNVIAPFLTVLILLMLSSPKIFLYVF